MKKARPREMEQSVQSHTDDKELRFHARSCRLGKLAHLMTIPCFLQFSIVVHVWSMLLSVILNWACSNPLSEIKELIIKPYRRFFLSWKGRGRDTHRQIGFCLLIYCTNAHGGQYWAELNCNLETLTASTMWVTGACVPEPSRLPSVSTLQEGGMRRQAG